MCGSQRDLELINQQSELLKNAINDLTSDTNVLSIYRGNICTINSSTDFLDIDLHIIVKPDSKMDFIRKKRHRPSNWWEILFYEDFSPSSPFIVTHYTCFAKIHTWYKTADELPMSIWSNGVKALYASEKMTDKILEEPSNIFFSLAKGDIEFWKEKVFSYIHETQREIMRDNIHYALSNLEKVRWMIVIGWCMDKGKLLVRPFEVFNKEDVRRSHLDDRELSLLNRWSRNCNYNDIKKTMDSMYLELLRLNKNLFRKIGGDDEEEVFKKIVELVIK